jgi:hypothetical protein
MKLGGPKLHLSLKFIYLILEILNGFLSAQILFQKDVEPSVLGSSQAFCVNVDSVSIKITQEKYVTAVDECKTHLHGRLVKVINR